MADDVAGLESVVTASGRVEGERRGGHTAFLGIPYAVADRFAPPRQPQPWSGVRRCREIGLAAPQSEHFIAGFAASGPQGEDCLNLNVFTPAAGGARRPVMVWIHGGGFTHGAGYEALYNGGPLAERGDVVVVTLNYRLGALGFLRLLDVGARGNQGLLDQVAALAWVRDNISGFGGDPSQVTIFGESAGSASVGCLVAMPAAKGLFKRAIYQSGVGRAAPPETADRAADAFLEALGLDRSRADVLRTLPADALVKAQAGFGPVRDPETLPEDPAKLVKAGGAADLDLLIGFNRDEVKLFVASRPRDPIGDDALAKGVREALPKASEADAREVIEVIRASRQTKGLPFDNLDVLDAVQSAARFGIPSMRLALAQSSHRDAYHYLFTHTSPARRGALGACHALEMPFVFGTLAAPTQDRFAGTGPDVERLSADMMDAWLAFARTGDPSCDAVGKWPAYREPDRATMVFGTASSRVQNDPLGDERRVMEPLV